MSIEPWDAQVGPILSEEEIKKLIIAYVAGKNDAEEDEIEEFIVWASDAKVGGIVLDLVLRGWIAPVGMLGEKNPVFSTDPEVIEKINNAFRKLKDA